MDTLEILKIVLPALLVLITAYLLIDKLLRSDEKRRKFELFKNNLSVTTPLRLRAYERLILVLERTNPNILLLNTIKSDMTSRDLHTALLSSIRQEFSHNLSQQIYVSNESWNYFRSAQESLLRLVNTCAAQCNPNEKAGILAERIIQVFSNSEQTPTELAISKLKEEVQSLFKV
ncbi:MAG: hypothetical protein PHS59_10405 [Paludibacter sp.]|nr:hypothetical protein [Paludibacter sp.]